MYTTSWIFADGGTVSEKHDTAAEADALRSRLIGYGLRIATSIGGSFRETSKYMHLVR